MWITKPQVICLAENFLKVYAFLDYILMGVTWETVIATLDLTHGPSSPVFYLQQLRVRQNFNFNPLLSIACIILRKLPLGLKFLMLCLRPGSDL